ncbi:hypothetical protein EWM64_g9594 [Hericium alpestre]|uniref:HNH nuclease domain-containing protein n=1 Tax=Hericium alpestre TaxID=135208 RepID=A0A4Y9ZLW6_9AGAM|nr:hypothetical protein EWM64_g9594 [Hericium alpestre]
MTFDILVNFTRLPVKTLEDLQDHLDDTANGMMLQKDAHYAFDKLYWCLKKTEDLQDRLDDPSNGMMLEYNAHYGFDKLYWCLKKTEHANEYTTKIFRNIGNILMKPEGTPVVFRDHSDDFTPGSTRTRKKRPISLPDPHYIAIHAAIAEILHMSGAGKFFDKVLDRYRDEEDKVPLVRCWPELERLMEEEQLRESVMESFQSVRVH